MLGKLFPSKEKAAFAPDGERIYAIGDIHGCAKELTALLALIDKDDQAHADTKTKSRLIFLGDYVDRGPQSKEVIDQLLAVREARPDTIFLKGNHEAAMLDFLDNPEDMYHWLDWGGENTLESYGVSPVLGRAPEELGADLIQKLPEAHNAFLRNLDLHHEARDFLFVHAGVRPGVALEDQQEEDVLWIRKPFHNAAERDRPEQVVVHGHQPMKKPLDAGWRIGVDTGACWTGKLTAVVLEGTTRKFLST